MFYVSAGQADIQVPWELMGQSPSMTVSVNSQVSMPQPVKLSTFAPGIFSTNANGRGQGAILNGLYQLVDAAHPAMPGDVIQIYCTGLGPVTSQPATGSAALTDPLSMTTTIPSATIGETPAPVLFSGLAPGYVGLYQVNVQVPAGTRTGNAVPVAISIGGVASNSVTIAVQSAVTPNPLPSITSLSPNSAPAGSSSLTLTINGGGFIPSSTVTFNGAPHTSTFVNSSQLTIIVNSSDLATPGGFVVVVTNPPLGGGTSNAVTFNVTSAPVGLTGTWSGAWGSIIVPNAYGSLSTTLVQSGTSLTGSITLDSVCFPGGPLSGTISGNQISATIAISGIQLAAISGAVDATDLPPLYVPTVMRVPK
jgi:uncharacterized protein (TIGR03437 family)